MGKGWLLAMLMVGLVGVTPALAGSEDALLELLVRKGILTRADVDALRREMAASQAAPQATPAAAPGQTPVTEAQLNETVGQVRDEILTEMAEKAEAAISLWASLAGEVRWRRHGDLGDRDRGATSDIFLRSAEVGLEFKPTDFLAGTLVLKSEWLGADTTDTGGEADSSVVVDVGTITFEQEDAFPLYAVIGKRTQPFGAFYERLVTDPASKDAYEVNQVGGTVGYKNSSLWGLDVSFTAYRQEELMDHLFDSGLFDGSTVVRSTSVGFRNASDDISSFMAVVNLTPLEGLALGGGLSSEPGDGRRNQTAGLWGSYTWGPLTAETEFFVALSRERYVLDTTPTPARLHRRFNEKLLSTGLYYRPVERLELGVRYAHYWDDGLADHAEIWSVRNRAGVGAGWTLFEKGDISATVSGEYRYSDLRRGGSARDTAVSDQHELFGKVAVSYR